MCQGSVDMVCLLVSMSECSVDRKSITPPFFRVENSLKNPDLLTVRQFPFEKSKEQVF